MRYVIPFKSRYLYHDAGSDVTALLNASAIAALRDKVPADLPEALKALAPTSHQRPVKAHEGPIDPPFLGILPTRSCKLGCRYCAFGVEKTDPQDLDVKLAQQAVSWYIDLCKRRSRSVVEVHFFGGEPFVAKQTVESVVHYTRYHAVRAGLRPRFEASTNGVFDDRWRAFVGDYFDAIVLSMDGSPEYHDRYRPNLGGKPTFEEVHKTALWISRSRCDLCLRVCVTSDNVGDLPKIADQFCRTYRPSVIDFEGLKATKESQVAKIYPPDPVQYARAFIAAERVARAYGVRTVYAAAETDSLRTSFCPVGKDTLILSADGSLSSCYLLPREWIAKGLDLRLGQLDGPSAVIDESAVDRLRSSCAPQPKCVECFARYYCAGGCHVSNRNPETAEIYDDFCVQTRLILAARLLNRMLPYSEVDAIFDEPATRRIMETKSDRIEAFA